MRHFGNTWSLLLAVRATKKALFKKSGLPRRKVNIIVTQVVEFSSGGGGGGGTKLERFLPND